MSAEPTQARRKINSKEYLAQLRARRESRGVSTSTQPTLQESRSSKSKVKVKKASSSRVNQPKVNLRKSKFVPGVYKPRPEQDIFEWQAPSRLFKKRDRQYLTTVIVIVLLISLILFFAGQLLPIAVVASVAFLVYVLSVVPPHQVTNKLTTYGIRIEDQVYYWEEMGRFWFIKKYNQHVLHIELFRFPGRIALLVSKEDKALVTDILQEVLLGEKPKLTPFEKSAEWLQKKIPLDAIG